MICKEGPELFWRLLRELEDRVLLVRHQSREGRRMSSMVFEIYEKPQTVCRTQANRI